MFVAIALSSSVSLARFVEPMVRVLLPFVCALRLPMISSNASRVNFVDDEMLRFALMLIMWIASRLLQLENIEDMSVTFDVSNCGTVVSLEHI